jgi:SAM-dependent methyltransferase
MDEGAVRPARLVFRQVVQRRLEALFGRGDHVLDLGCGTGGDALVLAARGVRVTALDPSPAAIAHARGKAEGLGLDASRCRFEVAQAADAAAMGGPFGGAYASVGALDQADLRAIGTALAAVLRPHAPVLLALPGPWPLPAVLRRALTGVGRRRREWGSRVGGPPGPATCPTVREAERGLGSAFVWSDVRALGVLLPVAEDGRWASDHPQAFGILAAAEGAVRRWPMLRHLGDHVLLEGRRSDAW